MFLIPWVRLVGFSKGNGKLNTFENSHNYVNLTLLLLAWGGQRVIKNVSCPEPSIFGAVRFLTPFGHRRDGFYFLACVFDLCIGKCYELA